MELEDDRRLYRAIEFKYRYEAARLATFKNWPLPFINKYTLAQSGMIYVGYDAVCCQYCCLSLDHWRVGEKPYDLHLQGNPNCPLLTFKKTDNVPFTLGVAVRRRLSPPNPPPRRESLYTREQTHREQPHPSSSTAAPSPPAHFTVETSTSDTFQTLDSDDSEDDNSQEAHTQEPHTQEPHRSQKPHKLMRNLHLQQIYQAEKIVQPFTEGEGEMHQHICSIKIDPSKNVISGNLAINFWGNLPPGLIRDPDEKDKPPHTCRVCYERPLRIAFIPCGHQSCDECSRRLENCPVCRTIIIDRLRVYT